MYGMSGAKSIRQEQIKIQFSTRHLSKIFEHFLYLVNPRQVLTVNTLKKANRNLGQHWCNGWDVFVWTGRLACLSPFSVIPWKLVTLIPPKETTVLKKQRYFQLLKISKQFHFFHVCQQRGLLVSIFYCDHLPIFADILVFQLPELESYLMRVMVNSYRYISQQIYLHKINM